MEVRRWETVAAVGIPSSQTPLLHLLCEAPFKNKQTGLVVGISAHHFESREEDSSWSNTPRCSKNSFCRLDVSAWPRADVPVLWKLSKLSLSLSLFYLRHLSPSFLFPFSLLQNYRAFLLTCFLLMLGSVGLSEGRSKKKKSCGLRLLTLDWCHFAASLLDLASAEISARLQEKLVWASGAEKCWCIFSPFSHHPFSPFFFFLAKCVADLTPTHHAICIYLWKATKYSKYSPSQSVWRLSAEFLQ